MSNDIEKLEDIKEKLENLRDHYDEMLDELYPYNVGNAIYTGSKVLKAVDPITYEVSFNDYADSEITKIKDELEEIENSDHIDNEISKILEDGSKEDDIEKRELKKEIEEMLNEYGY